MKKLILMMGVLGLAACGTSPKGESAAKLTGAGATFPLPYYNLAFKTYFDSTHVSVSYGGIGSGGGIRSLKDRIVDFAGSDAFLSEEEMRSMPDSVVHLPTCMGAVVMAYNLPQVKSLRLTGEVIASIYLGEITRWDDPRIGALNPGAALPEMPIHPVYRSDGSGTTYVFSDYLSKVSPSWSTQIGRGKALSWPVGLAAKGNPGISGTVSQTQGAIGYIGSEYAFAQKIPYATLQNRAGEFVTPTLASIAAAAEGALPLDMRCMITDAASAAAYPISCFTWVLVYREQHYDKRTLAHAQALAQLLDWMLSAQAQELAAKVNYAPLPTQAVENARKVLSTLQYDNQPLLR
ncbi:MAG: phosphate ABC transporter substrate-binding protein PstS [Alistipes sp.]|nr:phosphate ABC transporter substrate-binding protein PstS [Alistipes sp.]